MANGWFNVDADTRKNIHPFNRHKFSFVTFGSAILGILPRYDYNNWMDDIGTVDTKRNITNLLSELPSIKIREFTQDLKITTVLNLIESGIQGFKDAGEIVKGSLGSTAYAEVIKNELSKKELYEKMFGSEMTTGVMTGIPNEDDKKMLTLVYNLYYHIMGHTSTNLYELPFISKFLYETNGMDGWSSGPESGWGGTSTNSILGKMLNFIGSNYKIVTEPIWKPISNSNGTNIEMTVHLFNDTLETAAVNYIFVQTITSHNMPLQYGIIQQQPSCYEINITGGKRLFMCSGKFSVSNIGNIRKVKTNLLNKIKEYTNEDFKSSITEDYIRIPDIYEVKLTFKSLLPDVFNDFMYQFSMRQLDTFTLQSEQSVFQKSEKVIEGEISRIKKAAEAAAAAAEGKQTNQQASQGASS